MLISTRNLLRELLGCDKKNDREIQERKVRRTTKMISKI